MPRETQDTEVTLSTGKLLAIFFGMVMVCAVFFSFGYMIGHGSREQQPVVTDSAQLAAPVQNPGPKPSPGKTMPADAAASTTQPCEADDPNCTPPAATQDANENSTSNELSFVKPASDASAAGANTKAAGVSGSAATAAIEKTAPEFSPGFMVQVAAVSKQEDAEVLANALRKKQYPVVLVPNQQSNLFHVQVGPFAQLKDAEAMRLRLANDGYNAILKK